MQFVACISMPAQNNYFRFDMHPGSVVCCGMVDKYQPLRCIGGRVHEHFASCKVRGRVCINAGFGSEVNVLVDIENNKIKRIDFYSSSSQTL